MNKFKLLWPRRQIIQKPLRAQARTENGGGGGRADFPGGGKFSVRRES